MGKRASRTLAFIALATLAACGEIDSPRRLGWTPAQFDEEARCSRRAADACGALGTALVLNSKRRAEIERGLVLLEMACGLADQPSCVTLGKLYLAGYTGPTARVRGLELLSGACRAGSAAACEAFDESKKEPHPEPVPPPQWQS